MKKKRKYLRIAAVMLSSVASMAAHGQTADSTTPVAKKAKKGELSRHHRTNGGSKASGDAADTPPHRNKKSLVADASDSVKNSKHAASWTPLEGEDIAPPAKLNPALMASAERDEPVTSVQPVTSAIAPVSNSAPAPLPGDETSRYPWKRQIVTTTFWVGESASKNNPVPNRSSCWDPRWAQNYGGSDAPEKADRTADYIPASFTPGQNPFYVALPYNDMEHGAHKAEAAQVIPWFAKNYQGPTKSVCQGRWIAIRFGNRICYAQWEDAGPFRTDAWQYVFGDQRPSPNLNHGAGLDVSPAVRDFLGMNGMDVTDWKFVDFDEVPSGPWAKFGENNTFVMNERKSGSQVAEVTKAQTPVTLRELAPAQILR